jgi:transcriptional regulator with XRE-family HTH domain
MDVRNIVAKNIVELRQLHGMTQLELAEKLNYSDKTISKWERAESTPDVSVLIDIADIFGVTLDYLVKDTHEESTNVTSEADALTLPKKRYNRRAISYVAESIGWIVAVFAFIITTLILRGITFQFLYFVYTLPIVLIVKLVFNSVWFNPRHNYFIISALMWSALLCLCVTFAAFSVPKWEMLLPGLPGQLIIWLCSRFARPKADTNERGSRI